MSAVKPSLELLRQLSDEHVLAALIDQGQLTRAELATWTGISKPTVGESVRRLEAAGVVVDTGHRTTGRGRVGSYYALADDIGCALAVSIAPDGVTAHVVDAHATLIAKTTRLLTRPARSDEVATELAAAAGQVCLAVAAPVRLAVVSAADPVRRGTGHLVHLPDAPFLLGELSPAQVLADVVDGPVLVDNDVHWAARAERAAMSDDARMDDFVYLYLGEGLGCAVVSDAEVRRGHGGIAGEIAHVITTGPSGRAMSFIQVFAELGLRRHGSTAIDVDALTAKVAAPDATAHETRTVLASAICGVLAAAIAFTDPATVILGGPWGTLPDVVDAIRDQCNHLARTVPVRPAAIAHDAALTGASAWAVRELRQLITDYRRDHRPTGDATAAHPPAVQARQNVGTPSS